MSATFDVMLVVLVLLTIVLIFRGLRKNNKQFVQYNVQQSESNNEDHFSWLIAKVTPVFYWRVHNEYDDFIQATIKKMTVDEIISQPELFNAQRRCSDLNSAVYRYYENIKKRCADGEKVAIADIEVINLRQCFNELSCHAYPELVALIWPQYQRPVIRRENITSMANALPSDVR